MKYELLAVHDYGLDYTVRMIGVFDSELLAQGVCDILNSRHAELWKAIGEDKSKEELDTIFESIKALDTEAKSTWFKTINRYQVYEAT